VRSPIRLVALTAVLAVGASLLPADAEAQRRGGGRAGARVARPASRPVAVRPRVTHRTYRSYRSYGYRPYGYRPYYYGSYGFYRSYPYWWGAYGWSPYWSPYAWGAYGYPYYWGGYYRHYDPSASQGAARLQVVPRDTEVFVDGYFAGVVDDFDGFAQRLRLEPGEHELTLYLDGHRPLTRKVMFTLGQTIKVQHEMEPLGAGEAPAPRPVPTAKPAPPARRYGRPALPPRGGQRDDDPSPAAPSDIEVERPERPEPRDRPEPPDRPGMRERAEPPAEAGRGTGTISVRVQPDDAEILIDGEPWAGSTGERLVVSLSPGVHRLEVRKAGFEPYSGLIRVRPNGTTTLNVALSPIERR
jgi:hypothetical protein